MTDEAAKVLLDAFSEAFPAIVIVGDEKAARELARACAGALERSMTVGFTRHMEGWPANRSLFLRALEGELTPAMGLRSALRQDPDFVILEAPLAELPIETMGMTTQTGHGLIARVEGCLEEGPVLDAVHALDPILHGSLPRVVVADAKGVQRIVDVPERAVVWRRGDPVPSREVATGIKPRVIAPPPPREPVPPLEPELMARVAAALGPHVRPTWRPVLAEASGDAARSKLHGLPLLAAGEEWPRCGECGDAMPLAVQLARSEVPAEAAGFFPPGAEHFQFFYCTSGGCGVRDPAAPASKNKLLRFVAAGVPAESMPAFQDCSLEPRDIASWERCLETPHWEDLPDLAEELREARFRLSDRVEEPDATDDERRFAGPWAGEKLLGWPRWEQGPEWEECPRCKKRLELFFQVDADMKPLEMLFAADGKGHVSQCPEHKDVLAFRWACG